jgi:calcium-dependent protein kinase
VSTLLLILRFIEGGELFNGIIRRKFMCEENAAYIIGQLIWAITYCHSRAIVHRDLKPENILIDSITEEGKLNIKIIDFGAVLFVQSKAKLSETKGTPYYIASEVLKGSYNEKCDVWSIGVILLILLSGCVSFNDRTDKEIMENVTKGEYNLECTIIYTL